MSKKILYSLAAFLVIVMCFTFLLFRTEVGASILSDKYHYLFLEKQNLDKFQQKLEDNNIKDYLSEYSLDCKVNAQLNGDLDDLGLRELSDFLSKFELNINHNINRRNPADVFLASGVSAKYDGKKLLDVFLRVADNKALILFPEQSKAIGISDAAKTLGLNRSNIDTDISFEEIYGISEADYNSMIKRYLKDVIIKQIPDENVIYSKDAVFDGIKCESIQFNIDEKVMSDILLAIAEEAENDKDLKTVVTSFVNYSAKTAYTNPIPAEKITPEEIEEGINAFCDYLRDEAEYIDEIQFTYTAYFNNDNILSRQLKEKYSETSLSLATYKDLVGVDIFKISLQEQQEPVFELLIKGMDGSDNTYKGAVKLDIGKKHLVEAQYQYEKEARVGNLKAFIGTIDGKINLKQFTQNEYDYYDDPGYEDIYFSFSNSKTGDNTMKGTTKISSKINGSKIEFALLTDIRQSDTCNITKPNLNLENSIDINDTEAMAQLGEDIINGIAGSLSDLFPQPDYEDYNYEDYNYEDFDSEYNDYGGYEF